MKFSTSQERLDLIKSFEEKAEALTQQMLVSNEIPKKTKVSVETITTMDENPKNEDGSPVLDKDGVVVVSESGDILFVYIRQPHLINATQIMDTLLKKGDFEAGYKAFDSMVLVKYSSPEVEDQEIKFGLCWRLAKLLSLKLPDIKKN